MSETLVDYPERHKAFLSAKRKHVLMVTNHGIHEWNVIPGLPDTGGQDVFVNQLSEAMVKFNFKVTIANRGGYPHPATGVMRTGLHYRDDYQRILYLEDSKKEFVRKEDMNDQLPMLVGFLKDFVEKENTQFDLIISHYWDAAKLCVLYNKSLDKKIKHIWVPHSLGMLKKDNVSPDKWKGLRIDERIEEEKKFISELDSVASTSSKIEQTLLEGYGCKSNLFLPPCINTDRFHPQEVSDNDSIWEFLGKHCGLPAENVRNMKIITEISRTDTTKRKNILIEAFAKVYQEKKDVLLVVSIDENERKLAEELKQLIAKLGVEKNVAVVGSVWDILPVLYRITHIYCTPSVMEGFGMAVQEAAASRTALVSSDLVPFVTEYQLGKEIREVEYEGGSDHPLKVGEGSIVVHADDIEGFATALKMLLKDDDLRNKMADNAYHITVPYFTWDNMVSLMLEEIGVPVEHEK